MGRVGENIRAISNYTICAFFFFLTLKNSPLCRQEALAKSGHCVYTLKQNTVNVHRIILSKNSPTT